MVIDRTKYPYLFFDLDGTLTDSRQGILRCIVYALEKIGMPVPPEETLEACLGPPLMESFTQIFGMDTEMATRATTIYRERFSTVGLFENSVYEGIGELLARLGDAGYTLAIATSKPEIYTRRILDYFNLTSYFATIAGCSLERDDETKADVIGYACERLGICAKEHHKILMIGDRKQDILGAHAQHIACLGVAYGYAPEGELETYGADMIVPDVPQLRHVLLGD